MAFIVMLYDADPVRRQIALEAIRREPLPNAGNLLSQEWAHGPWQLLTRGAPSTPVRQNHRDSKHHVIMGRLLDRDLNVFEPENPLTHPVSGYGVKISVDVEAHTLTANTDYMGTFPLYYVQGKDWMIATSTPGVIKCHPGFKAEWDMEGLASVLLTMHLITGQTVWKGIRRLNAGHELSWNPDQGFRETPTYRVTTQPPAGRDMTDAIADRLSRVIEAWRDPSAPPAILLSGGLDSRLLAGLLRRNTQETVTAYTNGIESDLEVQCARLVTERLNFRHHVWEFGADDHPNALRLAATLELGSNGLSSSVNYAVSNTIPSGSSVISGYSLDCFMQSRNYYRNRLTPHPGSEDILAFYGRWGFGPEQLTRLIPSAEFQLKLSEVQHFQRDWLNQHHPNDVLQSGLFYEGYFRQRHHIAGMAWRLCWGVWPIMPAYDAPLTEMILSVPDEQRIDRKIERDILCRHFPELARIPLDANEQSPKPLIKNHWWNKLGDACKGWHPARVPPVTSRQQLRYYRTLDINSPNWRRVRESVEPLRESLHNLVDPKVLEELLPKPDVTIEMQRPIPESSGRKTLMGLMHIAQAMKF